MRPINLIFCLAFATFLPAQKTLTGRVIDANTEEPVPFATVYVDGTSTGDVTAEDGTVSVALNTVRRPLIIVISHLNYQNRTIEVKNLTEPFLARLRPAGNELAQIEVDDVDQRVKNVREFRERMLGTDDWGLRAELLNDDQIIFERDRLPRKSGKLGPARNLRARSQDALRVQLTDLGYLLRLDLVDFLYTYANGQMSYLGTSFFIPVPPKNKRQARRYERNRNRAYYGSQLHFSRALLADSLDRSGFQVSELVRPAAGSRPAETAPIDLRQFLRPLPDGRFLFSGLGKRKILILYYGQQNGTPLPPWRQAGVRPAQSRLFLNGDGIIYPDGSSGNANMVFSGDIGRRKMAWWLPSDFQPTW